jgi:hypothetical protein
MIEKEIEKKHEKWQNLPLIYFALFLHQKMAVNGCW